ncbi:hypothetical protein CEB94_04455 [Streptomyces hawaiiensis]|uniref:Uncharacterized protein n=1 Tax=Streptomyces hawaiiensis TaxID=67305 RepID=A0A6G5R8H6_9ACTN|nr:hypothetical protein [Streptomyces hawaiiensis]QCD54194.1 hypothetical protein CEB94_04455 [Streptomyces hawaiiensis]
MSHQPDRCPDIDGDVYVSPRHLASTTGTGDPALAPLLDLGWDLRYDEDASSPKRTAGRTPYSTPAPPATHAGTRTR